MKWWARSRPEHLPKFAEIFRDEAITTIVERTFTAAFRDGPPQAMVRFGCKVCYALTLAYLLVGAAN